MFSRKPLPQTKALLTAEHLTAEVILDSHANMERYAAAGTADCIVFNFGRLPGGDPSIFTQADSSVAALEAALRLLKPGGVIAVALYYGGTNGYGERDAVLSWLEGWTTGSFPCSAVDWANRRNDPPCRFYLEGAVGGISAARESAVLRIQSGGKTDPLPAGALSAILKEKRRDR